MNDSQTLISLGAAFTAGLLGSVHCFGMCGGLASAMGMRARTLGASPSAAFALAMLSQVGRIGSYALLGAVLGFAGSALSQLMSWVHLAAVVRMLAGVLLIAIALRIATGINLFAWLENAGARVWTRGIAPRMRQHTSTVHTGVSFASAGQVMLFGALWGWLPCGLVYSMALYAAMTGHAAQGALVMLAFGAGTLPSMLTSSVLAAQLARFLNLHGARWVAAIVLTALGVWTIVSALGHRGHH
jgi:uncharacterized protein